MAIVPNNSRQAKARESNKEEGGEREEGERTQHGDRERLEDLGRERERNGCARTVEDSFLGKPGFPVISRG